MKTLTEKLLELGAEINSAYPVEDRPDWVDELLDELKDAEKLLEALGE